MIKKDITPGSVTASDTNFTLSASKASRLARQISPSKDLSPALSGNNRNKEKTKTLINEILIN
jgi:hypothetical protein